MFASFNGQAFAAKISYAPSVTKNLITTRVKTTDTSVLVEVKKLTSVAILTSTIPVTTQNKNDQGVLVSMDISSLTPGTAYSLVATDKDGYDYISFMTVAAPATPVNSVNTNSAVSDEYKLLAPLPNLPSVKSSDGLGGYLNTILMIAIGIAGALSVIMLVIAGIQYIGSESVFGKTEAKGKIINTIGGLLLALGSWALLNTINPDLLGGRGLGIATVTINIAEDSDTPQTPVNGMLCAGKYPVGSTTNQNWNTLAGGTEASIRTELANAGITIKPGTTCTYVGQQSCTSVSGLDTTKIKKLAADCKKDIGGTDCGIEVTGGTECWLHGGSTGSTYHMPGKDTVDLSYGATLKPYVEGDGTGGMSVWGGRGTLFYARDMLVLVKENIGGLHYHFASH